MRMRTWEKILPKIFIVLSLLLFIGGVVEWNILYVEAAECRNHNPVVRPSWKEDEKGNLMFYLENYCYTCAKSEMVVIGTIEPVTEELNDGIDTGSPCIKRYITYYYGSCEYDGELYTDRSSHIFEAEYHNWDEGTVTKRSDCTQKGRLTYTCTECGKTRSEALTELDPNNHRQLWSPYQEDATCETDGHTNGMYCMYCFQKVAEDEIIPATGHSWGEGVVTKEATLSEAGEIVYTCNTCGTTKTEEIPALEPVHVWDEGIITKIPNCHEIGEITYTCEDCGETKTEELPINSENHAGGTYIKNDRPGDCSSDGSLGDEYCSGCNAYLRYLGVSPRNPDNHGVLRLENVTEASCSSEGYTGDEVCPGCLNIVNKGTVIPKLEHSWDSGQQTKSASCCDHGEIEYKCTVCGETKTEETGLDSSNHSGNTEVINSSEADCKTEGYTGDNVCADCRAVLSYGEIVPELGHTWNGGEITRAATCSEKGVYTYTCEVCGDKKAEDIEIDSDNHGENTSLANVVKEGCESVGYSGDTVCNDCGAVIHKGHEIEALGHTWDEGRTSIEADCTKKGEIVYSCGTCGKTRSEETEIDPDNHTGSIEIVGASGSSCSADGYSGDKICSGCGAVIEKGTVMDKQPHSWNDGEITKEATCRAEGVITYTCNVCGEKRNEAVAADQDRHARTEIRNKTEENCTQDGYSGDTVCCDCGSVLISGAVIPKSGHIWDDGKITRTATCSAEGEKTYSCMLCGALKTESISKDSGNHGETVLRNSQEATCSAEGYSGDLCCVDCGTVIKAGSTTDKLCHSESAPVRENIVGGTCGVKGSYDEVVYCGLCGAEISRVTKETDALEHTWDKGIVTKEASCCHSGVKKYTCSMCGAARNEDIPVDSAKHGSVEIRNALEASCSREGYSGDGYCTDCGNQVSSGSTISRLSHSEGAAVKENERFSSCGDGSIYDEVVYCKVCGAEISRVSKGSGLSDHNWNDGIVTNEATCSHSGTKMFTCLNCGTTKNEEISLNASNHGSIELRNATDSSCAKEGYTGDKYCADCGELIERGLTIAKSAHTAGDPVKENVSSGSCRENGTYDEVVYCVGCGAEISRTVKDLGKEAHFWDNGKVTKNADCSHTGIKTYTCKTCGETKTEILQTNPDVHGGCIVRNATNASCVKEGYTGDKYCPDCGKLFEKGSLTEKLSHSESAAVRENEINATCFSAGYYDEVVYCRICGTEIRREHRVTEKAAHLWESGYTIDKAPTCIEDGSKSVHCSVCDEKKDITVIEAEGHSYGNWSVLKVSDCINGGVEERSCVICNHKEIRETAAKGHSWNDGYTVDSEATCTESGSKSIHCRECNAVKSARTIEPKGHDFTEWKTVTAPSCTESGSSQRACKECGYKESRNLNADGHDWEDTYSTDKESQCTVDGSRSIHCKSCGAVKDSQVVPATGHHYDNGIVTKEATQQAAGEKTYTCRDCGDVRVEAIDRLPVYTLIDEIEETWEPENGKNLVLHIEGDWKKFRELMIDGNVVDSTYYTVSEGSTIITLKSSYMELLSAGAHIITAKYVDGEVSADFVIAATDDPDLDAAETNLNTLPDNEGVGDNEEGQIETMQDSTELAKPVISNNVNTIQSPKTGDNSVPMIYFLFAIIAAQMAVIVKLGFKCKKLQGGNE